MTVLDWIRPNMKICCYLYVLDLLNPNQRGYLWDACLASSHKRFYPDLTPVERELSGCVLFKKLYFFSATGFLHIKIG